ncbi:hypothetical protein BV898_03232 [Hypsibius exemplaris]|uniref:Secreted protein n=1 Tax=Hypsibius exemplaris TaxID=2072580 RepID=A0A1W0X5D8_HYPEX|nr:hypothetical protein BV898_03232 [Hypsibius exemplaris]
MFKATALGIFLVFVAFQHGSRQCYGRAWFRKPPTTWDAGLRQSESTDASIDSGLPPVSVVFPDTLPPSVPLNESVMRPTRLQMLFLGNFGYPASKAKVYRRRVTRQSGWIGNTVITVPWRASPWALLEREDTDQGSTFKTRQVVRRRQNSQLCYLSPIACFGRRQMSSSFRRPTNPIPEDS